MPDWKNELKAKFGERFLEQIPLAPYTTYKIGGPAETLLFAQSPEELRFVAEFSRREKLSFWVLGRGSNVLVSDDGLPGVVCVTTEMNAIGIDGNFITAQCGSALDKVVELAVSAGLCGMEFLSGIPGSVGGAVWMNAGAFGQEVFDRLVELTALNQNCEIITLLKSQLKPSYRKVEGLEEMLVLSARWELLPSEKTALLSAR
ncbi:MAG: FAD-binding protein, partial [Elusimicrobia bacterium]|nr:FAD-binding protein [Elusimicrobiota bacterium]